MENLNKYLLLIILLLSYSSNIFAQEDSNIKQGSFYYNSNYVSVPMFFNLGYRYRNNGTIIFPYLGFAIDFEEQGKLLTRLGVEIRKNQFFTDFGVVQQILPSLFAGDFSKNAFTTMDTYGEWTIGYDLNPMRVSLSSRAGLKGTIQVQNISKEKPLKDHNIFISEQVFFNVLILDDFLNKINSSIRFTFDIYPIKKQYSYSIDFRVPMSFLIANGWLEILFLNNIFYTDLLSDSTDIINIAQRPSTHRSRLGSDDTYYQFSTFVEMETRLYLASLPSAASRIYFAIFANVGYGLERDLTPNQGELFYMFGGGIGYNMFDGIPFQLQVGMDNKQNFLFTITFMSLINFPT